CCPLRLSRDLTSWSLRIIVLSKTYKWFVERSCLAAVVQSQRLGLACLGELAGSLVYDTGFPSSRGDSREPGFESRRPHFILQTSLEGRVYPRSNPLIVEGQEHSLKSHGSLHLPVSATFGALWGPLHPDSYWVSDGAVS